MGFDLLRAPKPLFRGLFGPKEPGRKGVATAREPGRGHPRAPLALPLLRWWCGAQIPEG